MLEREPLRAAGGRRASCAPTATRASGTAWTPTRTPSCSTTSGPAAQAPWTTWDRRGRSRAPDAASPWSPAGEASSAGAWLAQGAARARRRGAGRSTGRPAHRRRRRPRRSGSTCSGSRERGRAGRGRPARRRRGRRGGRAACDSVFHLAAQTIVGAARESSPCETFEVNVRGTWTCFEACRAARGVERVVFASSDKAYGASAELPYREDFPLRAAYPYEASKAAADIDRAQLLPRLRAAGRGHPLRQHLRRRRPQLLAPDPGGDRSPCSTAGRR